MAGYCNKCRENDGLYITKSSGWNSSDVCSPQKIEIEFECWYCDNKHTVNMEFKSWRDYLEYKEKYKPYND